MSWSRSSCRSRSSRIRSMGVTGVVGLVAATGVVVKVKVVVGGRFLSDELELAENSVAEVVPPEPDDDAMELALANSALYAACAKQGDARRKHSAHVMLKITFRAWIRATKKGFSFSACLTFLMRS